MPIHDSQLAVAGKSTLLRILAGKRLTKTRSCKILGQDVFMNPPGVSAVLENLKTRTDSTIIGSSLLGNGMVEQSGSQV